MLVELEQLKANPMRNFTIDPIDPAVVAALKHSIEDHGFWGGVVCRQRDNGTIEIAAGHHRVQAAIEAGLRHADLFVREDVSDGDMVLVYATENGTQRGNTSTALAGTVASAMSYLLKGILTGTIVAEKFFSHFNLEAARRQIEREGVGREIIVAFLKKIPGINNGSIQHQLANLKASGDYARIVTEVEAEIAKEEAEALAQAEAAEREHQRLLQEQLEAEALRVQAEEEQRQARERAKAARETAERLRREAQAQAAEVARQRAEAHAQLAEKRRQEAAVKQRAFEALRQKKSAARATAKKASIKAAERPRTFDFEGVAKHFKNPHQMSTFREVVNSTGILPLLPVEQQAALAQELVNMAQKRGEELTGRFIRENIRDLITLGKAAAREATKAEQDQLLRDNLRYREEQYQIDMARALGALIEAGRKLEDLYRKEWPSSLEKKVRLNLREGLTNATVMIERALALL